MTKEAQEHQVQSDIKDQMQAYKNIRKQHRKQVMDKKQTFTFIFLKFRCCSLCILNMYTTISNNSFFSLLDGAAGVEVSQ